MFPQIHRAITRELFVAEPPRIPNWHYLFLSCRTCVLPGLQRLFENQSTNCQIPILTPFYEFLIATHHIVMNSTTDQSNMNSGSETLRLNGCCNSVHHHEADILLLIKAEQEISSCHFAYFKNTTR